jgi:EAL domain-containing protein (putative c-di-GMP-specific phosphodiesterase class I)
MQSLRQEPRQGQHLEAHTLGGSGDANEHESISSLAPLSPEAIRLNDAINNGNVAAWFQPIVDMRTYRVAGFEVLARWQDGDKTITPANFIPLAEDTGLIHSLTTSLIISAIPNLSGWRAQTNLPLTMAVNISPLSVGRADIHNCLYETIAKANLDPQAIHVELTESRTFPDPAKAAEQVGQLKARGLRISLDDFGTGYSSFEWLMRIEPHTLKIDRMFVADPDEARSLRIMTAQTHLGKSLGISVVAEGIESVTQWQRARDVHVDYAQGFLIGRPMTATDVTEWLTHDEPKLRTHLIAADEEVSVVIDCTEDLTVDVTG